MSARKRVVLRSWRVQEAEPSGFFVWFDPTREGIELYELDPPTESGVADACEGDDQRGLWDAPGSSNNEVVEDDLPFKGGYHCHAQEGYDSRGTPAQLGGE